MNENEKEMKKKESRERLENYMKRSSKKERKKALIQLLKRKAVEKVKEKHELSLKERKKAIDERSGEPKNTKDVNEATLREICRQYHERIVNLTEVNLDLEVITSTKELEINELKARVMDLKGKFIIPPLKRVSKPERQLEKMRQWTMKLAKMDMKGALRPVKKEILDKEDKKEEKPEWLTTTTITSPKDKTSVQMF